MGDSPDFRRKPPESGPGRATACVTNNARPPRERETNLLARPVPLLSGVTIAALLARRRRYFYMERTTDVLRTDRRRYVKAAGGRRLLWRRRRLLLWLHTTTRLLPSYYLLHSWTRSFCSVVGRTRRCAELWRWLPMDGWHVFQPHPSSSATTRPARWRVFKQLAGRLVGWLVGSLALALALLRRRWRQEITPCRTLKSITERVCLLLADSRVRLMTTRPIRSSGGPWRASFHGEEEIARSHDVIHADVC